MTHTHTTPCTTTTTTTLYITLHDTTLMPLHYTTRLHYSTQQYSTRQYATWQRSALITPHRNYNCNGSEGRNGPPGNGLYCLTLLLAVFSKLRNARLPKARKLARRQASKRPAVKARKERLRHIQAAWQSRNTGHFHELLWKGFCFFPPPGPATIFRHASAALPSLCCNIVKFKCTRLHDLESRNLVNLVAREFT